MSSILGQRALPATVAIWFSLTVAPASAQVGAVQKISATQGGFEGVLFDSSEFGRSLAYLGDLDGNGVGDIAVGAPGILGMDLGVQCVWLLFLDADGRVEREHRIAEGEGGFAGPFDGVAGFGYALAALGDLNGDGRIELAVGEVSAGPQSEGSVWILSLTATGNVAEEHRIDDPDLGGALDPFDHFGAALCAPGDLDGDGHADLLVGAPGDDDGGASRGAFYSLFLHPDGGVRAWRKTATTELGGAALDGDRFGSSLALLDDLDGDGLSEIAVGAPGPFYSQPPVGAGAVWILFPGPDGSVRSYQEIGAGVGGFDGVLEDDDKFGSALSSFDDLDGDGRGELFVGARQPFRSGGVVYLLFLAPDGRVRDEFLIGAGGLQLASGDNFGCALAALSDLDRDGFRDLAVGAYGDRDGVTVPTYHVGAAYVLFFDRGLAPLVQTYGCGTNPPGSLVVRSGRARIGRTLRIGLTNPLGTQQPGSLGLLWVALRPDPSFPCGTSVPGLGMSAPGSVGELLVDRTALSQRLVLSRLPAPWPGPGGFAEFRVRIPLDSALVGTHLYLQGLLIDMSHSPRFAGLSEALELRIGSPQ